MYKIRLFTSSECDYCSISIDLFCTVCGIDNIEIVDAFDDETQDLCDNENVDELPHAQILKDGKVIQNIVGFENVQKYISVFYESGYDKLFL